ncbi:amidohydrolase family protein [Paraburkholderia tropica]|uniref:Predicted metal-dependent hydrolase, TIM-barrel fold n=2 Tax=Pseudomonadota TaxID=1224 RepID=A0A1A5X5B1_9BURK|nr:amidohydrolase family protein [Paraburkholderia tropica]MBB2982204.1 putative TIM-barrel fold metal-dependent hydrolase [Paraburkholderia tropica]MBB3001557.1 putative TIM-barrel fold metal-dependent hydrolase [Paraburkholderia tropica]MBB6322874.1 putative TIM-barrel fold metal-dependent hydrolase [Paraburkholderia tropica]MDE1139864.1 amidohydrolase family protein [Paraburkholderia tropica]OBR48766.1 amidohydrolase [Paraburkholderia tropica]
MSVVIDTHTHAISPDTQRYPLAPVGGHQSEWSAKRPVDYEGLLASMDEAGIDRAVVVQASTVYGNDNSYVVDAVRAHPDRFAGVFSIDVLASDAVTQMQRWLDAGLSGLRLFTTGSTMPGQAGWLDDERSYPVWDYAQRHGVSICLQMTAQGIPALLNMLARFPDIRVLLDHLARPELAGGPPYEAAAPLFSLASHQGVYLKLTNRTIAAAAQGASTPAQFFPRVLDAFGAKRIAWGSNFPAAEGALSQLLTEARESLSMLPTEAQQAIFSGTARAVYPSLAA